MPASGVVVAEKGHLVGAPGQPKGCFEVLFALQLDPPAGLTGRGHRLCSWVFTRWA